MDISEIKEEPPTRRSVPAKKEQQEKIRDAESLRSVQRFSECKSSHRFSESNKLKASVANSASSKNILIHD